MNRPTKLLIVDDESNIRLVFHTSLGGDGQAVAGSGEGDEAPTRASA